MLHDWQTRFAERLRRLPPDPAIAPMQPGGDDFLGPQAHRFAVYRDNMMGSLVEALGDTFPVVRQLLGDRFFDAVAADFVRSDPPVAPRLSRYGSGLPARLRTLPQLTDLAYVIDVAVLEWARVEAYFAGAGDTSLAVETLLAQPGERLPHLVFQTAPGLRIVATPTAAHSIWLAHQAAEPDLAAIDPWQSEAVRLLCTDQGVLAERITAAQAIFLLKLQAGQDLTAAAEAALDQDSAFDLQAALAAELGVGSFTGFVSP
jgi:hypothetical protein